ncbi:hypothetical protein PO80_02540 [Vibrio parahaemolyticus]|nr:hypothetical protein PO80_02540 [Vibrio parahaemolyticus]OTV96545.1 hypothetical protein BA739_23210 [Vibrio parahaemolyticus]OTV99059.1 hypothetical protein BA740_24395 [Vibrio parahaemolyticus]
MVLVMVLLLAKQIITLYHVVQKILTKDQHALVSLRGGQQINSAAMNESLLALRHMVEKLTC